MYYFDVFVSQSFAVFTTLIFLCSALSLMISLQLLVLFLEMCSESKA